MPRIYIGDNKKGEKVYVQTIGITPRLSAMTNKKISVNQRAKLKYYRDELVKECGTLAYSNSR